MFMHLLCSYTDALILCICNLEISDNRHYWDTHSPCYSVLNKVYSIIFFQMYPDSGSTPVIISDLTLLTRVNISAPRFHSYKRRFSSTAKHLMCVNVIEISVKTT